MFKATVPLAIGAAILALAGCTQSDSNATAGEETAATAEGEGKTIAAGLDQNSQFFQAAKATGLDSTLAGPGPYTVLVPSDQAFQALPADIRGNLAKPEARAQVTRVLTYHILPGVILSEDIARAIETGQGKAVLATMGGETLTATREGGNIVLSDGSGGKATITQADEKYSNGAVHRIDAVLTPGGEAQGDAGAQQR